MAGFWGATDAMREAAGWPREWGAWQKGQVQPWLASSTEAQDKAKAYSDWAANYYTNLANAGIGTPADITATGKEVMPGVDEAIATRKANLDKLAESYGQLPKAGETMGDIYGNLDTKAAQIAKETGQQQANVFDVTGRELTRENAANQQAQSDVANRYGQLSDTTRDVYDELRRKNAALYEGLQTAGTNAYGDVYKNLALLNPAGEAAAATTTRSYAPMMAGATRTLRAAGISPNSPEAMSMIGNVQAQRARGVEATRQATTQDYVAKMNEAKLGEQAQREKLGIAKFGGEAALQTSKTGIMTDLSKEQGNLFRTEALRSLAATQGIDVGQAEAQSKILTDQLTRNLAVLDDKNKAALLSRTLEQDDWQGMAEIIKTLNQEELTKLGLEQTRFQAGMDYTVANMTEQDKSAAAMVGLSSQQYVQALNAANQARAYGTGALDSYLKAYAIDAQSAGWGAKLLAAIGVQAFKSLLGLAVGGGTDTSTGPRTEP